MTLPDRVRAPRNSGSTMTSATDTTTPPVVQEVANGIRTMLGLGGLLAVVVGILILVSPLKTAAATAAIVAVYAAAVGVVYLGSALFSKGQGGWHRVGAILLGLLYLAAGIVAIGNLTATAAFLFLFITIMLGITWIVEGIVTLTSIGTSTNKVWVVVFAVISVIAGVTLLFSPMMGAVTLWWLLGISLIVLGILQIVRALTFGKQK